nr:translation initiation factor IF-2-like [Pongo abelii]
MAPRGTAWAALPSSAPRGPAPAAGAPQPEPAIRLGPAQLRRRNFRPGAGPAGTHAWGRVGPRVRPTSLDGDTGPATSGAGRNAPVPCPRALKGRRSHALLGSLRARSPNSLSRTPGVPPPSQRAETPPPAAGPIQRPRPRQPSPPPAAVPAPSSRPIHRGPAPSSRPIQRPRPQQPSRPQRPRPQQPAPSAEAPPPAAGPIRRGPAPSSRSHPQRPQPQAAAPAPPREHSGFPRAVGCEDPSRWAAILERHERCYGRERAPEGGWKPWTVGRVERDKGIGGASVPRGRTSPHRPSSEGRFRPRLQQLVATNPPELGVHCSTATFCLLPDVGAAGTELCALCGVGPPQPRQSWQLELQRWTPSCQMRQWPQCPACWPHSTPSASASGQWTPYLVETALWTWAVGQRLWPDLLPNLGPSLATHEDARPAKKHGTQAE